MKVPVPVKGSMMWTPSRAEGLAEMLLQHLVDRVQDEIDDLDRGVDDAQLFGRAREGVAEELVVEFDDQALFGLRVGDARAARSRTLA